MLFSALLQQAHCILVSCGYEWVTVQDSRSMFQYIISSVLTVLTGHDRAGATQNCCHLSTCSMRSIHIGFWGMLWKCHVNLLPSWHTFFNSVCTMDTSQSMDHASGWQWHFILSHMRSVLTCIHSVFSCSLPPAFLCATSVTWGWHGYQNKSQHRKLTLEKKILLLLLPGLEPVSQVWYSVPLSYPCSNKRHWVEQAKPVT